MDTIGDSELIMVQPIFLIMDVALAGDCETDGAPKLSHWQSSFCEAGS